MTLLRPVAALALTALGWAVARKLRKKARRPLIIAHRGASGLRPEHTLAAYELAIDQGADYIEPDLVPTKDGVLVSRHENDVSNTTDVADHPEFADRRTEKEVDGKKITGWFTEDFTLAELKTLRAKEPLPFRLRNKAFDGKFPIVSLDEIIALVKRKAAETGRTVGIYPEVKHPAYFRSIGLSLEERVAEALRECARAGIPVFLQCFEAGFLQTLHGMTDLPLIQLIGDERDPYDHLASPAGLAEIAGYARGIAPSKDRILPPDPEGILMPPTALVRNAHAAGLLVHAWTLRDEDVLLLPGLKGNAQTEYRLFAEAGVDGVLTDHPGTAVAAYESWPSCP